MKFQTKLCLQKQPSSRKWRKSDVNRGKHWSTFVTVMTSLMIDDSRTLWHRMTVRATRNKGAKTLMDSTPPRSSKPPGPTHAGSDCTTGNTCRKPKPWVQNWGKSPTSWLSFLLEEVHIIRGKDKVKLHLQQSDEVACKAASNACSTYVIVQHKVTEH